MIISAPESRVQDAVAQISGIRDSSDPNPQASAGRGSE